MSEQSVWCWWKDFRDGLCTKDNTSDKKSSGRPRSARTDENTAVILEHVLADRHVSVVQLSEQTGLSVGSVHKILCKDLKMSRVCVKFVPRLLKDEEKTHRMVTCQEWIDMVAAEPRLVSRVITGDESWVWMYDPESKMESTQWVCRNFDSRPQKALQAWSTKKLMILPFFDIQWIIHVEFIQGTIKSEDYIEILMRLRGPHPPYSPDLAPCDFFLFPKLKRRLWGRRFPNLDELRTKVETILNSFTEEDFKYCFLQLQDHWIRCIDCQGNYFEGDCLQ